MEVFHSYHLLVYRIGMPVTTVHL